MKDQAEADKDLNWKQRVALGASKLIVTKFNLEVYIEYQSKVLKQFMVEIHELYFCCR